MQKLKNITQANGIPLLYIQNPAKYLRGYTEFVGEYADTENAVIDNILRELRDYGIDCIDIREAISQNGFPAERVFYHTDGHATTEFEIHVLDKLLTELDKLSSGNISFHARKEVLNLDNYTVISKPFLGNFSRSVGKYYTYKDIFNMYVPRFDTKLTVRNHAIPSESSYAPEESGSFQEVLLNGSEQNIGQDPLDVYWVINYLQFPSPYYDIFNSNGNKNFLVIMDSHGLRTAAYLSLLASQTTVVDPRYQGNNNYVAQALETNEYDAVIVIQGDALTMLPYRLISGSLDRYGAQSLALEEKAGKISLTFKNTGSEPWKSENGICLGFLTSEIQDIGYRSLIPPGIEVKPGDSYSFTIDSTALEDLDTQNIFFSMCVEGVGWFGENIEFHINSN
jgi:hypothetical protein